MLLVIAVIVAAAGLLGYFKKHKHRLVKKPYQIVNGSIFEVIPTPTPYERGKR